MTPEEEEVMTLRARCAAKDAALTLAYSDNDRLWRTLEWLSRLLGALETHAKDWPDKWDRGTVRALRRACCPTRNPRLHAAYERKLVRECGFVDEVA
jgi:hypothetical protein